jgi:hypothetical protein
MKVSREFAHLVVGGSVTAAAPTGGFERSIKLLQATATNMTLPLGLQRLAVSLSRCRP